MEFLSHVDVERNSLSEHLGSGQPVTGVEVTGGAMAWEYFGWAPRVGTEALGRRLGTAGEGG